jgi:AbiV family abortive infection protein
MTSSSAPDYDHALLSELAQGAKKTFENAEALFHEAKILARAGALSRALFLHQISLEECAKIETMGAWATSLLTGLPVDQKKVLASFSSHARKNRTNAYMLEGSAEEKAAKERGDWKGALAEFKKLQDEFHQKSNDAKNASLYVDFKDGKFVAPMERITEEMLAETATQNKQFLGLMHPKVEMLLKWEKSPEEAQERAVALIKVAEATKVAADPKEAMAAIEKLIGDFVEIERTKRTAKSEGD